MSFPLQNSLDIGTISLLNRAKFALSSVGFSIPYLRMAVVVKHMVTPNWLALVNGNLDYNPRSNSWWFKFDPQPDPFLKK